MIAKPTSLGAVAAAAALAIAGCGGGGGGNTSTSAGSTPASSGGGGGETLNLSADPSGKFAFDKKTLSAKAGKITIVMKNSSSLPHAIAVQNQKGQVVTKGGTSTVTVSLKPGTYTFYCPVDGHRAAGMQGTLTVK